MLKVWFVFITDLNKLWQLLTYALGANRSPLICLSYSKNVVHSKQIQCNTMIASYQFKCLKMQGNFEILVVILKISQITNSKTQIKCCIKTYKEPKICCCWKTPIKKFKIKILKSNRQKENFRKTLKRVILYLKYTKK